LLVISAYHLYFAKRLIPGIYIAGLEVGGNTYNQAVEKLIEYDSITTKKIDALYEGKTYEINAPEIELIYDWEATVNRAFEVGRTGNLYMDSKDKIAGLFKKLYIATYYDFNEVSFDNFLATIRGDLNSPAENARYILKNQKELEIIPEKSGQIVNEEELYKLMIKSFDDFKFGAKTILVEPSEPTVSEAALSKLKQEAESIVFGDLKAIYEDKEWALTDEQKISFLSYDPGEKDLAFNKVAFKSFLEGIALEINKLPRGIVTQTDGERVVGFKLIQDGLSVNEDITSERFREAYFGAGKIVAVKVDKITGPIDPKEYGIFALLGEGNSKFTGSAPGRIHNLTLAAERTDGVLVAPGEIYSMNDSIGAITAETGYNAAWVIMGNRTVMGHGGGVCQTSTTLFRAILNSGLPVVTRHPHAYRVYYYEIESPVGIDASVYQPTLDLQFKNDTPNYVLVQTSWNLEENSLTFKLYGTPDGREVEISEPVVTNETGYPAAEYRDDPTLAMGVVRQIDFAASGATASFTRKVTRGEELLYDDVFTTHYQPWRAIYLVGTKE